MITKTIDPTSIDSIMSTVRTVFPDAELGEDMEGQVVIYTALYSVGDSSVPLVTYEETTNDNQDG